MRNGEPALPHFWVTQLFQAGLALWLLCIYTGSPAYVRDEKTPHSLLQ